MIQKYWINFHNNGNFKATAVNLNPVTKQQVNISKSYVEHFILQ